MRLCRLAPTALALALPLLAAAPAAADSSKSGSTLRIDVHSDEGDGIHLTLGAGLISGLVRAVAPISIDCNEPGDADVRRLFRELDRAGEPAHGTLQNGDDFLDAHREHGRLRLKVTDEDGDVTRISLPWVLARCVLGGENVSRGELAHALESVDFSIDVDDEDSDVHIRVE